MLKLSKAKAHTGQTLIYAALGDHNKLPIFDHLYFTVIVKAYNTIKRK